MKCPYSQFDLLSSKTSLVKKVEDPEFVLKVKEIDERAEEPSTDNIAKHYGITNLDLINSPNYTKLCDDYYEEKVKWFIKELEAINLTHKEAWVFVMTMAKGN